MPVHPRTAFSLSFLPFVAAVVLRLWSIHAPFGSSDQVTIPHAVTYTYGLEWIVAHDYGPVLPLIQRTFAEGLWRVGLGLFDGSFRLPIVLISLLQVPFTALLLGRLGWGCGTRLAGTAVVSLMPILVCDAYCPWAYRTVWLLAGTIALWATLAWMRDRRPWQLVVAGIALTAHCLSCLYAFALPLTIGVAWLWARAASSPETGNSLASARPSGDRTARSSLPTAYCLLPTTPTARSFLLGYVLPCVAALGVIVAVYLFTDGGQIRHLLMKRNMGTFRLRFEQLAVLPRMWVGQFGHVAAVIAAGGLGYGAWLAVRRECSGLLGVWAWAGLLPIVLVTDWRTTGYPDYLFFETTFATALLAMLMVARVWAAVGRLSRVALLAVALAVAGQWMAANIDALVPGTGLQRYSGITPCWGRIHEDTGLKAAGCYVRDLVPADALIMATHDNMGFEVLVAEYYCGRAVLAGYDHSPALTAQLLGTLGPQCDVIIVPPEHAALVPADSGHVLIATLRHDQRPVRLIYARPQLGLITLDADVAPLNARFEGLYRTRRIPTQPAAPPAYARARAEYQSLERASRGW